MFFKHNGVAVVTLFLAKYKLIPYEMEDRQTISVPSRTSLQQNITVRIVQIRVARNVTAETAVFTTTDGRNERERETRSVTEMGIAGRRRNVG
jgi:hypothetical protein